MLVQFTVGNWASFKGAVTLSLEASASNELEESNLFTELDTRLLRAAVIYGANASGKSNLLGAMQFMRKFAIASSKESQVSEPIEVQPFLLSTACDNKPSRFEIVIILDGIRFRYGFEVDAQCVFSEWLYSNSSTREAELFTREGNSIEWNPERFKEGKGLQEKTRPNALFLSVVSQFNGEISGKIVRWLTDRFNFVSALRNPNLQYTINRLSDPQFAQQVLEMSKLADLGIEELVPQIEHFTEAEIETSPILKLRSSKSKIIKSVQLRTKHRKFDADGNFLGFVEFDLEKQESTGTVKYIAMTGPIIETLRRGNVLVVDELDARLHPLLCRAIVSLFQKSGLRNNAQLIFATHDTHLLNRNLFRRDQVWFTEKDQFGASSLYSLDELKVRKEALFGKDYILGKFGAIPFIGDATTLHCDG